MYYNVCLHNRSAYLAVVKLHEVFTSGKHMRQSNLPVTLSTLTQHFPRVLVCIYVIQYSKKHWWIINCQSFLPQIYGIFTIHLPLLGHSPNFSPPNNLRSWIFHQCFLLYSNERWWYCCASVGVIQKLSLDLHLALVSSKSWVHTPQHLVLHNSGKHSVLLTDYTKFIV